MSYAQVVSPVDVQRALAAPPSPPPPPGTGIDAIVAVAMENRSQPDVWMNANAPFQTAFAQFYSFVSRWHTTVNPSQGNYVALVFGTNSPNGHTFASDGDLTNINHVTIVDLLEAAGKTYKLIAEDASGTGASLRPPRNRDHYAWLTADTIRNVPARAQHMIPGDAQEVLRQFDAGVNFIWITPNETHNAHSASTRTGDDWLRSWIGDPANPAAGTLLAKANASGKRVLIVIWYDEGYISPDRFIYLGIGGTAAKRNYISTTECIHPSLAKLIEAVWGGGSLGERDVTANAPTDCIS